MYACPQGSLPNPHLSQQSSFLHSASWVPASQFSVSPDGKFTLFHQCSFIEWGKEQKRIKVRICQGQGLRLEPGVGKEAVQSCGKLEWIRQRQPVAERSGRKVMWTGKETPEWTGGWWSQSHTQPCHLVKSLLFVFFLFFFCESPGKRSLKEQTQGSLRRSGEPVPAPAWPPSGPHPPLLQGPTGLQG